MFYTVITIAVLIILVLLVLVCAWKHDLKSALFVGSFIMAFVGQSVRTIEFQTSTLLNVHDVAYVMALVMFCAAMFSALIIRYAGAAARRRRNMKKQVPSEEVEEQALSHS